jgi:DsbC/DsbD-like thiol-disulfide interchange protein
MQSWLLRVAPGLVAACLAAACGGGGNAAPPAGAPVTDPAPQASSTATPIRRPTPQVDTTADLGGVTASGGTARLVVRVTLPPDLHVQANQPRDPALIPTELSITPPAGTALVDVTYPEPIDFNQAGATQPLAVYPNVFDIVVRLKVAPGLAASTPVTATLRYQACNDVLCFAPANTEVTWTLTVPQS